MYFLPIFTLIRTLDVTVTMEKYQNKYRNASARAQWWDYSANGLYYITACTKERKCTLGRITNEEMFPSPVGEIVLEEWHKSFDIRKELSCDIFQMMPNHLHAILRIERVEDDTSSSAIPQAATGASQIVKPVAAPVDIINPNQMRKSIRPYGVAYRRPKSISSFMGGFKSSATTKINDYRLTPRRPVWQSRFHDHLIRNFEEYHAIYLYIQNNVKHWKEDQFHNDD